jgi:uncharacterized protein YeaO (DUF488 family)
MLAQFFANVSPSDEIRKGWQRYYEEVNKEYLAHLESLNAKEKQLQELQNSNSKTSKINTQAIEKLNKEIESMTEILMIRESVKQRLESAEEAL